MGRPRGGITVDNAAMSMVWRSMRQRCNNPKAKDYPRYGGRGIKVCERWNSFVCFLSDMGPRPPGATLDRKDNDGPYSPENCRWSSVSEQNMNRRDTRRWEVDGLFLTPSEIEKRLGLGPGSFWHRLRAGWPVHRAVSVPKGAAK